MSGMDEERDDQKPKGVFSTLMANGNWLYNKREYKKAIYSYTTALTLKPDDKTCFLRRSKCYLKMWQLESALEDAEASLKEDKTFFEGLYQKAETLYLMGEFEFALVFYHRAQKLRPMKQECRLGIQKAQEAIENSVGTSLKLKIKGDLSFLQKEEETAQPIAAIQHLMTKKTQQTQKTPKSEKATKQLLEEFYSDRKFLENLLKDEGKLKGGKPLQDVIQGCLTYIDTCTEFRNQAEPVFAREKERKLKQQKRNEPCHSPPSDPTQFLLKSQNEIDADLASGNAKSSLKKANKVMKIVQDWSEEELPGKEEALCSLHSCIGNALMDLGDMDKALDHHQKDFELAKQCKLPDAMSRALANIGRVYALIGQFTQAIEFWEQNIHFVQSGLEETWLFHEIGWCYLKLDRHEEARVCGIRSVAAADEIADEKWQRNANVLVAHSELKLGNIESCVSHFEKALTQAKLHKHDFAVNGIQKALDEAKQHLPQ